MRSVSWRLMLGGSMLLFVAMSLVVLVTPAKTYAAQRDAGCYIHLSPGWQSKNCDDFKVVYPSFSPAGDKCYFSWGTVFGPTPPVDIDCTKAPEPNDDIILPQDNQAGMPSAKVVIPSDIQRQDCTNPDECLRENELIKFIKVAVNIMSALVGVVVTAMIVIGGIQYASAGGSPNATSAAKKRIFNAILALIAYLFLFVILEWLLPGGLF